jgi:hypothetical protein
MVCSAGSTSLYASAIVVFYAFDNDRGMVYCIDLDSEELP